MIITRQRLTHTGQHEPRALTVSSDPILETPDSFFLRAVIAAEKLAISFQPMTDNAASACAALRCHRLNGALETVERHCPIAHRHLKRFIVVVTASVTFGHCALPCLRLLHSNLLFASQFSIALTKLRKASGMCFAKHKPCDLRHPRASKLSKRTCQASRVMTNRKLA